MRCVDLGVHQDDVLAVLECLQHDMGAELDGAGRIHHHIDELGTGQQQGIIGRDRTVRDDRLVELPLRSGHDDVLAAGIAKHVERALRIAVGYGDHAHPGRAVHDLVGQALRHEAGADDRDPNGISVFGACLESGIDQYHGPDPSNREGRQQPPGIVFN